MDTTSLQQGSSVDTTRNIIIEAPLQRNAESNIYASITVRSFASAEGTSVSTLYDYYITSPPQGRASLW